MSEARSSRYAGRSALRRITTVDRCFDCGWAPNGTAVGVRFADGVAGYAGLATCGRIWLCPVCNSKVMARRSIEIGTALLWAQANGLHVVWGSLTMRHNAFTDLGGMLELQRAAWHRVVNSRVWKKISASKRVDHVHTESCEISCEKKRDTIDTGKPGRVGYIRAAELNFSDRNGWHPHFHPIILVRGSVELAQRIADEVVTEWVHAVEAEGGEARLQGSQQLRVVSSGVAFDGLAGYVTKATYDPAKLALETVWSQGKVGRGRAHETVSHWSLLAHIETGDMDYVERWWQLEEAVHGHRMITWSHGLRSFVGMSAEQDDDDIAAEEVGTAEDTVCFITGDGWRSIRDRADVVTRLLDVLELSGWAGLRSALDLYGVEYFTLETAPA